MNSDLLEADQTLKQVLSAAYEYWLTEPLPLEQRVVCYTWVATAYRRKFGGTFHQSKMQRLVEMGLLTPKNTSQGGNRRYYTISDSARVHELMHGVAAAPSVL